MANIEQVTRNQYKLMKGLLKLNRPSSRRELLNSLKFNPTSLQFAITPLKNFFIKVEKDKNRDMLSLTERGKKVISAWNET